MKAWKGVTPDGTYGLLVEESALSALDRLCREAGSNETGGVLVGRYSTERDLAIVQEATPPPSDSRRGHAWFERGVAGLREMFAKNWQSKERTYYLGEWHFHPAPWIEPSADDFSQMLKIARNAGYDCKEPLLLICGAREGDGGVRALRAFVCPAGGAPMELLRASDVPKTGED